MDTVYHKDLTGDNLHSPKAHATSHQSGGSDVITVTGLSGLLSDAQKVTIRKNSGSNVGTRHRLNFIEGSGTTLTITDDATDNEVDITIASAGGSHNLLSTTHPDTLTDSVVAGDLLIGNTTPKWARLPKGTQDQVLTMGMSLPQWTTTLATGAIPNLDASKITTGTFSLDRIPTPLTGKDADTVDTKHFTDIQADAQSKVDTHAALTTGIHGVGASTIESTSGSQAKVDTHASATTGVHGVGNNTIEHTGHKGVANGYCELDASTLVPLSRIPSTLTGKDADTVDTKHFTDIQADAQSKVDTHAALTTGIHGVGASTIESTSGSQAKVDTHASATTGVHGVGNNTIEHTGHKGVANGYCELDASTLVPLSRIPSTLTGKDADTVDTKHFTDIQNDAQSRVDTHASATTGVHGVGASTVDSVANRDSAIETHRSSATHVTAQPVTVRKNSGTDVGTRKRLNLVEGTNITLTVADDATDNEVDITVTAAGGGFDPTTTSQFYEEFDSVYAPTSAQVYAGNTWEVDSSSSASNVIFFSSAERGGVIYLTGDTTHKPFLRPAGSNTSLPYVSSKNPTVIVRQAQYGTTASITRYVGLASADMTAAPANGIYFRHITGGNYIGVCRSASVETTLDTGVAAANGTFHTLKFVVNGTTSVQFFVDGVSKGTITTNIPTANLYFNCGDDNVSDTNGMYLNYVYISQNR
jgi:hypothetical protein